jgi:hypothetical protein
VRDIDAVAPRSERAPPVSPGSVSFAAFSRYDGASRYGDDSPPRAGGDCSFGESIGDSIRAASSGGEASASRAQQGRASYAYAGDASASLSSFAADDTVLGVGVIGGGVAGEGQAGEHGEEDADMRRLRRMHALADSPSRLRRHSPAGTIGATSGGQRRSSGERDGELAGERA